MSPSRFPITCAAARTVAASALAIACIAQSARVTGDDTEVYFGRPEVIGGLRPNVMFILDTSGSMTEKDGTETRRMDRVKSAMRDLLEQATDLNVGLMKFNGRYGGGPVLHAIENLDQGTCSGASCDPMTTSVSVRGRDDDVEIVDASGGLQRHDNELNLPQSGGDPSTQAVALRFTDLYIPSGATITEARVELAAVHDSDAVPLALDLRVERSADAAGFGSGETPPHSRFWSDESVRWESGRWLEHESYPSGDFSALLQRIVDRGDWCGGNAVAVRIGLPDGAGGRRDAMSVEALDAQTADPRNGHAPTLKVTYDVSALPAGGGCVRTSTAASLAGTGDDAEQAVDGGEVLLASDDLDLPYNGDTKQYGGVRFASVDVPPSATIRSARIELTVRHPRADDAVSLTIRGLAEDDAATFGGADGAISDRPTTGASVPWDNLVNPGLGETVVTPDVSALVAEVTGRPGWSAGDAVGFRFEHASGDGTRSYTTFDHDAKDAPRLVIEYETGHADRALEGSGRTVRQDLIATVDGLVAAGDTPLIDTLWEAGQYFRGGPVHFGAARGNPDNLTAYTDPDADGNRTKLPKYNFQKQHGRLSHPDSYTGASGIHRPSGCDGTDPADADCAGERIEGSPTYLSPIEGSCQSNHVVFLSDGETGENTTEDEILGVTGAAACTGTERTFGWEACGADLAGWLRETDHAPALAGSQGVRTHTIAFNLSTDKAALLGDLAAAGGGRLYNASSASDLLGVFNEVVQEVKSIDTSFTAPGATVNQFNRLTHRDDIYFAMFKPTGTSRWRGNLKRYRFGKSLTGTGEVTIRDREDEPAVDPTTGFFADSSRSFWPPRTDGGAIATLTDGHDVRLGGAANRLTLDDSPGIGARRVYTWVGKASKVPKHGVDLTDEDQRLHEANDKIKESTLGLSGGDRDEREARRTELLRWARGVDVDDEDGDGSRDDARRHFGDPMHSRPVIVNYAGNDRSIIFTATNEGFVHAIDTATGNERFAFMPGELLENLETQFDDAAGDDHRYGLDGALSLWSEDPNDNLVVDPGEKAYLFVGMRRGGERYYALDVSVLDSPRLAWAIDGGEDGDGDFAELGQSWSRMSPVRIAFEGAMHDVLLFTGGYATRHDPAKGKSPLDPPAALVGADDQGRGLFVVEATTGKLLWSGLGTDRGSQEFDGMEHALAGNPRAIDVDRDGLVDQVYAADLGGQVWRFDLESGHESGEDLMRGGVIAKLAGSAGTSGQRRFYTEPDVALIDDGGTRFLSVSIGSGWRAHPLDRTVQDRFHLLRQYAVDTAPSEYGIEYGPVGNRGYRPVVEGDLVAIADTATPSTNAHGWYLDLPHTGEKVLETSVTFDDTVVFTTYVPDATVSACTTALGGGRVYELDVLSGAPVRDLDGDGDIDIDDRSVALAHGGIPAGATVLLSEDAPDNASICIGPQCWSADSENRTRRTFWTDRGAGG